MKIKRFKTHKLLIFMIIPLVLFASILGYYQRQSHHIVLELGIFSGSYWNVSSDDYYQLIDCAIEKFETAHPGVSVHYASGIRSNDYSEWLNQKILTGKAPDVMVIPNKEFNTLVSLHALKDIQFLIDNNRDINSGSFFPFAYQAGAIKKKQYALPFEVNPKFMAVNKTLLLDEGFSVPPDNWTWDDFYRICKSVTKDVNGDGRNDIFGVCNYSWIDAVTANGASLFDENKAHVFFNDNKVITAVKFMQKLNDLNPDIKVTKEDFDNGKVCFMPLSFAEYKTYTTYPYKAQKHSDIQWAFTTLPAGPDGDNISHADVLLMGVNQHTKYPSLSYELLKTFTNDAEVQLDVFKDGHGASALKIAMNSSQVGEIIMANMPESTMYYNNKLTLKVLGKSKNNQEFATYDELMAIADGTVNETINNNDNAESALRTLQRKLQRIIEK